MQTCRPFVLLFCAMLLAVSQHITMAAQPRSDGQSSSDAVTHVWAETRPVPARSFVVIDLNVCGFQRLEARGDGATDLDFIVNDQNGNRVHRDIDRSDITFALLSVRSGCEAFSLRVQNVGRAENTVTVELIDAMIDRGVFGAGEYQIAADAAIKLPLGVCTTTDIAIGGAGNTDLDYLVTDIRGLPIHSADDLSARTEFTLSPKDGCTDYSLLVSNLGNTPSLFQVEFELAPRTEQSTDEPGMLETASEIGSGRYKALPSAEKRIALPLCAPTFLSVKGDGTTDLDFVVHAGSGGAIYFDYDTNDAMSVTLTPAGECESFTLFVKNLGEVENVFTVGAITESDAAPSAPLATGSSLPEQSDHGSSVAIPNRDIVLVNRTGEALVFLYWANSASLDWGDERLGSGALLRHDGQWKISTYDGSSACLFNFRAVSESERVFEQRYVNVCAKQRAVFE